MKLSAKIITFMVVLTAFFLVADYFINRLIVYPAFVQIEESSIMHDLERVKGAIDNEIEHLDIYCKDWAYWDDSYEYMVTHDSQFEESSLGVESLASGGLNLVMFVDPSGEVVWESGYDLQNEMSVDPEPLLTSLDLKTFLLTFRENGSDPTQGSNRGVVLSSKGPLLLAARQILTSDEQGPSRGTLIMGRFLSDDLISSIIDQTKVNFTIETIEDVRNNLEFLEKMVRVNDNSPYFLKEGDSDHIIAHAIILDFLDRPSLFIHVNFARDISRVGRMSMYYALLVVLLVGVFAVGGLAFFVYKIILKPILVLDKAIQRVHDDTDYTVRVNIQSTDEIGQLAQGFNLMLEKTEQQQQQLELINEELNKLARLDPLTQIANRRHFNEIYATEWKRHTRNGEMLSVIICDIDYFKKYNDRYGHQSGDLCLQRVAKSLENSVRLPVDCVARYGGEEFIVMLPETPVEDALLVAERMRRCVEGLAIAHLGSLNSDVVTLSLGVAGVIPSETSSGDELVSMADQALYQAKESGRNCSIRFSEV